MALEFVVPPRWLASSERELLRIGSFRKYLHDTCAGKQIQGDLSSPPAVRVVCALLPAFFIVTVWQLYNLRPSEIGTLMKNSSEELLCVAGTEVL